MNLRYLALGDSYTIGEAVPAEERWPVRLAQMLRGEGLPVADPEIIATTGWTTDDLSAAIDQANPQGPYALVSLLIGVNNQYRDRSLEEYKAQLTVLLRRAIDYAGGTPGRVMVLAIPDWGVTPFAEGRDRAAIASALNVFNTANRALALAARAHYVDVAPVSRLAGVDPGLLAPDGLHPSGRLYLEWARLALPAARLALAIKE